MTTYVQDAATREDLGFLAVMDALVSEQQVSQRELAHRTGLNLRKVNYCLQQLLTKGYVKFRRAASSHHKRSYLYVLTPAGLTARSQLTYRFLRSTLDHYNQVEARFARCLVRMAQASVRRLLLYGATEAARVVLDMAPGFDVAVVGVVDEGLAASTFRGVPVLCLADLPDESWDGVLVTALADPDEVTRTLVGRGLLSERIWRLS